MRVAIDTTPLSNANSIRGVGVYTSRLIDALTVYAKNVRIVEFKRTVEKVPAADLVHYPYFDPYFATLPLFKSAPTVVTVHDLIPIRFRDKFPSGTRGSIAWELQRLSLKGARRVIADSESSRDDIIRFAGIPPDRVDVVYLAPTINPSSTAHPGQIKTFRETFGITRPYLMYVGDVNWNKNVTGLLRAFKHIHRQRPDVLLVLVGKSFLDDTLDEAKAIGREIETLGLRGTVIRPGFVSEGILRYLYAHAECLVQPSIYEGFGIPVLDAMSCGCLAAVSNSSSLREISGPAETFDPHIIVDIADTVLRCMDMKPTQKRAYEKRAKEWLKKFSWMNTAIKTVQSYQKAVS